MSLAVISRTMARPARASRWATFRSVFSAQLSEVHQPGVGPLHRPTHPERDDFLVGSCASLLLCSALSVGNDVVDPVIGAQAPHAGAVVAPVKVQGLDVAEQAPPLASLEGRGEEGDVVAVSTFSRPAEGNAGLVGEQRPLPAAFPPVNGVGPGSLAASGRLVLGTVDGRLGEVQADHLVVGGQSFFDQPLEDPGFLHWSRAPAGWCPETARPTSCSASTHEHPVTRRTSIARKQVRFDARGR